MVCFKMLTTNQKIKNLHSHFISFTVSAFNVNLTEGTLDQMA